MNIHSKHRDHDLAVGTVGLGIRPALIIIDMSLGFTHPNSPLGGNFSSQVDQTRKLLDLFRLKDLPVYFTSVVYHDEEIASVFRTRLPDLNILKASSHWVEIDPRLSKKNDEPVIEKQWPSAFFKTELYQKLCNDSVDSIIVVGLTTSGCVRATAVDGLQYNFPVFVAPEACGDRNLKAQSAALHDINAKYGVVMPTDQLVEKIQKL
ncbi:isochorismatase family protein [Pseudocolwellia sp. HL-MZ19]|uniref:isochorismatase family protein n=1 Tax=unclassified Pseudocolwellia TaxID=2848178 RepID=UPI003CF15499